MDLSAQTVKTCIWQKLCTPQKVELVLETLDAVQAASQALSQIENDGFEIEASTDFRAIPEIVEDLGKPHLTPILSPMRHDYTSRTAFWLILKRRGGSAVGCVGARLEEVGEGEIAEYWHRNFARHYPSASTLNIRLSRSANSTLSGRLAYIGDLYIEPSSDGGIGRKKRARLSSLLHLVHALVTLEWKVDAAYSFITASDALRGAGSNYGFTLQLPGQKNWGGSPPPKRFDDEWLVILPAGDRSAVFRRQASNSS